MLFDHYLDLSRGLDESFLILLLLNHLSYSL